MKPLIIIPARLASTRLPNKPLADIHGMPMIEHVYRRAQEARMGPVIVASADDEIATVVDRVGGQVVMTDPNLPSGTDRVRVAADIADPDGNFDVVVNVQGDMPTMDPAIIRDVLGVLEAFPEADIATAVVATQDPREISDPNVVKAVLAHTGRALYFTRASAPTGEGPIWHHVGIYAYRRSALQTFCSLPPSPLEVRERLEQLRALEYGMTIYAAVLDTAPDGVDTPEDLERARALIASRG